MRNANPSSADLACLHISLSTDPDTTSPPIYLVHEVTQLGRPEYDNTDPAYIDLKLLTVSRDHARIIRRGTTYVLEIRTPRNSTRVFDRRLKLGDELVLSHGDIIWIPEDTHEHVKILFLIGNDTQRLPLHIDDRARSVQVFGDIVKVTSTEYKILKYLYDRAGKVCDYPDIIAALGKHDTEHDPRKSRDDLHVHLNSIRKKIRAASGGFTFLETVRKQGVRLVVGIVSES